MRKYLSTLHQKPERHKKRFAFLVSGGFTLAIFSLWSLTTFGTGGTLAQNSVEVERAHPEISPLESLKSNLADSLQGLTDAFTAVTEVVGEAADLEADYTEMKTDVLNTYGQ